MGERSLNRTGRPDHTHSMFCACPIHADENGRLLLHETPPYKSSRRVASPFPVWRSLLIDDGATPHWACNTAHRTRRTSPQALEGAGGERLLSIGQLEADMLIMTASEWYRGVHYVMHLYAQTTGCIFYGSLGTPASAAKNFATRGAKSHENSVNYTAAIVSAFRDHV
jgi:hypothetical protein